MIAFTRFKYTMIRGFPPPKCNFIGMVVLNGTMIHCKVTLKNMGTYSVIIFLTTIFDYHLGPVVSHNQR
jgi:hypothetical protein